MPHQEKADSYCIIARLFLERSWSVQSVFEAGYKVPITNGLATSLTQRDSRISHLLRASTARILPAQRITLALQPQRSWLNFEQSHTRLPGLLSNDMAIET